MSEKGRASRILAVPVLAALALVCATAVQAAPATHQAPGAAPAKAPHPPGWVLADHKSFTFYLPPDMKAVPVQPIDSYVGKYESGAISLGFDYGPYAYSLEREEGMSDYASREERIGGKQAKLVTYSDARHGLYYFKIGVYFAEAGDDGDEETRLGMFAECRSVADYETVRRIFRSIRFGGKRK